MLPEGGIRVSEVRVRGPGLQLGGSRGQPGAGEGSRHSSLRSLRAAEVGPKI